MATNSFLSNSDQFGQTKLNLDLATASLESIVLIRNGAERTMLTCLLRSLFTIRFTRHDLINLANNQPIQDDHPFGAVEYSMRAGLPSPFTQKAQSNGDGSLSFIYKNLPVSAVLPPRETTPPLQQMPQFGAIDVTLTFSQSTADDKGWIDFDLYFTYPDAMDNRSTTVAWETTVLYPQINFDNSSTVDEAALAAHELLFPEGPQGNLSGVHELMRLSHRDTLQHLMKVQYGALFKRRSSGDRINSVSGIALSGTDETGHPKSMIYQRQSTSSALKSLLRLPIHLGTSSNADIYYALPTAIAPDKPTFTLSKGDANGFGGAQMKFRLRAFQVDGVCPDARVGWTDVADVYRGLLKGRKPAFLNKPVRTTHGPIDRLSPHTVICNYSIDGQAAGPDGGRPVHQWLEVHPAKKGQSDTGSQNESLQDVLVRVRQTMETQTDWVPVCTRTDFASAPAISSRPNLIDIFARSQQNTLLQAQWNGGPTVTWQSLGGPIKDKPASVAWDKTRIDVFARSETNTLFHKWYAIGPGWTLNWEDLGRPASSVTVDSSPAVASRGINRLDCFVLGSDGAIWHKEWNAGWREWESWGKPSATAIGSAPAAAAWSADRVDCLIRGTNNALYHRANGLSAWTMITQPPGVQFQSDPAITSWAKNRLDVFAWGTDKKLWHRFFNGTRWTDWEALGETKSAPAAASWGLHRVDCFMLDGSTLKYKWLDQEASLEAQIWGFEMGGLYHYLGGYPPATNVVSGDSNRFRNALDFLNSLRIVPSITTDPLSPLFNRGRFRGHLKKNPAGSWEDWIAVGFHPRIENYKAENPEHVGPITRLKINGQAENNRAFLVKQNEAYLEQPNVPEAETLANFHQRYDPWGAGTWTGALSNALYNAAMRPICSNAYAQSLYLTKWAPQVLAQGARLIEFMKVDVGSLGCYNKTHNHLVSTSPSPTEYDNVMGHGSWYIQQLKFIWQQLQLKGRAADPSFALTCESAPYEMLVAFADEFYHRSLLFQYIYSPKVSAKMDLGEIESIHIHPGYKETLIPGKVVPPPSGMYMTQWDAEGDAPSLEVWLTESKRILEYYNITPGMAPVDYPTTDPGKKYTYQRCVQNYFNLRAAIFAMGTAAVLGERILLSSTWLEPPNEYLAEVIAFAVKAGKLHTTFKEFFREGFWLGQTALVQGQALLWAWEAPFRQFIDMGDLVSKLYTPVQITGDPNANPPVLPVKLNIADFISRATDKEWITATGNPSSYPGARKISTEKIQHNVWRRDGAFERELLYVFANVGNTDAAGEKALKFQYGKGLEGQTPPNAAWQRTFYAFSGDGRNAPLTNNVPAPVVLGQWETVSMPARSLLAVRLTR